MPWILPSHPAPALALKRWRPQAFSGLALALGTIAPDLEFILRWAKSDVISHSIAGQLVFTVPCVMLLYWLTTDLLVPFLLPYLPPGPPMRWEDLAALRRPWGTYWWTIAGSGAVGGLTHIFLDGFTHPAPEGWAVPLLPVLRTLVPWPGRPTPLHDLLQVVLTGILGAGSLAAWLTIAKRRELWAWRGAAPVPAPPRASSVARRALLGWLALCVVVCAALAPALRQASGPIALELAAYGALSGLFYGVVAAALWRRLGTLPRQPRQAPTLST